MTDGFAPLEHPFVAGVVIPAHNDAVGLARLLERLVADDLEVVVVANGCVDGTAEVARSFPDVRVVELDVASKPAALAAGDAVATAYPRIYVDADVLVDAASVRRLGEALRGAGSPDPEAASDPAALVASPRRWVDLNAAHPLVRSYYAVWERLPSVRTGVFGRGVVAMTEAAHERVRALPTVLADDLVISEAFTDLERVIVPGASVTIYPPRTVVDLLRRRERVSTGVRQADRAGLRARENVTRPSDLLRLIRGEPRLARHIPAFLAVIALGRLRARRRIRSGDFSTWQRDESSRIDVS